MSSLEELFCPVDDFCRAFEPHWKRQLLGNGLKTRNRQRSLGLSEVMTILIAFHQSHYRNFKSDYQHQVRQYWSDAFPGLVSYSRFVDLDVIVHDAALLLSEDLLRGRYGNWVC
jgi:hypothetical protein